MPVFLKRGTPITILEGPLTGLKAWVDCVAYQKPAGSDERANCYQVTLESGQWAIVRWDQVTPGWLSNVDLVWLLARLPFLTFPKD